jgi:threonine/homoserine/homoserine lactone efflux protein
MREFKNGLITGLTLQLAIGPVFLFVINLALQKTILDGFAGVLAATIVDYLYISLSILGIGRLLENKKFKITFGIISSLILIALGFWIAMGAMKSGNSRTITTPSSNIFTSFTTVFFITLSNPLTIVFFTGLFTAKAVEYSYTKKELLVFGFGTGLATFIFMSLGVVLFSIIKGSVSSLLITILNIIVAGLLIGYGGFRLWKVIQSTHD